MGDILWLTHPSYWEEIQGMAHAIGAKESRLLLIQYVYELFAFCTSTVAYDASGLIHHGRNLDFAFAESMRSAIYEAHFMKNRKTVFKAVMVGLTNGVTSGQGSGFTISLNQRFPSHKKNQKEKWANIANMYTNGNKPTLIIRKALENCTDY